MRSLTDIFKTELTNTKLAIIRNHIRAGQFTTGKTSRMLEVANVTIAGGQLLGFKYTNVWETGRKPGKMPPYKSLIEWVEAKFGITGSEASGIAFVIARKIGESGSALYRKGGRTDIITNEVTKLADRLGDQIGDILVERITGEQK